jgi:hypothetical protein
VTLADIEDAIVGEYYFTAGDGIIRNVHAKATDSELEILDTLTFCVLVLRNGFTVTSESACASPENFDAEIGRTIARQNAKQKIWALEGYLLKQRLYDNA